MELFPKDINHMIQNYVQELQHVENMKSVLAELINFFKQTKSLLLTHKKIYSHRWTIAQWIYFERDKIIVQEWEYEDRDNQCYNESDYVEIYEGFAPQLISGTYCGTREREECKCKCKVYIYLPCF